MSRRHSVSSPWTIAKVFYGGGVGGGGWVEGDGEFVGGRRSHLAVLQTHILPTTRYGCSDSTHADER